MNEFERLLEESSKDIERPIGDMPGEEQSLIDYIHKNFIYNEDGTFTRLDRKNSNGSYDKDGYLIIKIKGKQYKAHRLVYAYHNNKFPKNMIDHINRNRTDNRIENLRDVTADINNNNANRQSNKDTGVVGVHLDKTKGLKKKYAISKNGKTYRFYSLKDAVNAKEKMRII